MQAELDEIKVSLAASGADRQTAGSGLCLEPGSSSFTATVGTTGTGADPYAQ